MAIASHARGGRFHRAGGLCALDAIHLAAARQPGTELDAMVVYEAALAAAARAAGIEVSGR